MEIYICKVEIRQKENEERIEQVKETLFLHS